MSLPITVTKNLAAASSTSIGSITQTGTITLSCATLDTARRITIVGASIINSGSFVVAGLGSNGIPITETVVPSTTVAGSATTTQDFLKVSLVTPSCTYTSSGGALIGTNSQGGTPWVVVNTVPNPTSVSFVLGITSPSTVIVASFEYSNDYPSYDQRSKTWGGGFPLSGPKAIISSFGSSVTSSATQGLLSFPFSAWRVTITSSSSGAGSAGATVLQSGY